MSEPGVRITMKGIEELTRRVRRIKASMARFKAEAESIGRGYDRHRSALQGGAGNVLNNGKTLKAWREGVWP